MPARFADRLHSGSIRERPVWYLIMFFASHPFGASTLGLDSYASPFYGAEGIKVKPDRPTAEQLAEQEHRYKARVRRNRRMKWLAWLVGTPLAAFSVWAAIALTPGTEERLNRAVFSHHTIHPVGYDPETETSDRPLLLQGRLRLFLLAGIDAGRL
jgi:hypothetical protein